MFSDDGVFDDFPKISDHFPKISENFPKLFRRPDERSRTFFPRISENFRRCPKMSEDVRRLPKTFEEGPKYNLRDKLDVSEIIDIFTCEDIISSHVRISYRFYQFLTTRYNTDFYIININLLLTEREGRTVEYWPEVVAVRTEHSEVRTKRRRANMTICNESCQKSQQL